MMILSRIRNLIPSAALIVTLVVPGTANAVSQNAEPNAERILAHIDVETTGLIAGYNEVVDVGVVYTTEEGTILDRWYRRIMPRHLDRVHPVAAKINGFDPKVWRELGALDPKDAVEALLAFERQRFPGKKLLRVAYNSKFDAAFMDHLFRENGQAFDQPNYDYFWMDIPSMAWSLGYQPSDLGDLWKVLNVKGTSDVPLEHTGLGCAEANVRIYQALVAIRKELQK